VVGIITRTGLLAMVDGTEPHPGQATDAQLVAAMKQRLRQESWVTNPGLVWVEATGGVLFLAGLVESAEEHAALGLMARTIPGCTGVENETVPRSAVEGGWGSGGRR
jgi:osmotically-inducible protein OsmY